VTDGDQPEMSSEEMIRQARRELEAQPTADDLSPQNPEPEPTGPEPMAADFEADETWSPTPAMPAPQPPAPAAPDVVAPGPGSAYPTPSASPARTWLIVVGILIFGVGALVLMALIRGSGAVSSIDAGDCFQDPGAGEISRLDTVECTETHDFEAIGRVQLDDGPYPGDIGIVVGAVERCLTLFEPYVGAPFDETELLVDAFVPTPQSWDDGDRDALCVVFQADGAFNPVPIAGSARGSG